MSQENQEIIENNEMQQTQETYCKKRNCFMHKVFGLKGLSNIYKVLSILVLLYFLYVLSLYWYYAIKEVGFTTDGLLFTLQALISYGFWALVLYTVARVLKVLKKIQHAVNNK